MVCFVYTVILVLNICSKIIEYICEAHRNKSHNDRAANRCAHVFLNHLPTPIRRRPAPAPVPSRHATKKTFLYSSPVGTYRDVKSHMSHQ